MAAFVHPSCAEADPLIECVGDSLKEGKRQSPPAGRGCHFSPDRPHLPVIEERRRGEGLARVSGSVKEREEGGEGGRGAALRRRRKYE